MPTLARPRLDPSQHTAELVAFGSRHTIGVGLPTVGNLQWDTTRVPDGLYELQVLFRNQLGELVGRAIRDVVVNNQIAVHEGLLQADETWSANQLHVVRSDVFLRAGVTLTIEPGAIVKMAPLTKIGVEDGATFRALGTDQLPIMMTSLADDSFAGDTNLDAAQSRPLPGEWDDFAVVGGGAVEVNEFFEKRYVREEHSGSISQDTTWSPFNLHYVVGDVDALAGTTLTLPAGSVVKFDPATRLRTRADGVLDVQGQLANPVYFTSITDDDIGGDTNRDGETSSPQAGDWDNLLVEGQGTIRHAFVLYGAGATQGAIETVGAGEVLVDSTTVGNSLNDAFVTRGDGMSTLQNSVLYANARGVNYGDESTTVINSTIDANLIGLFPHGGGRELNIYNSQITNSIQFGFRNPSIFRTNNPNLFYSNIWSDPASGAENYSGLGVIDQTGTNGNISEPPGYVDAARRDYRLDFESPAIDAADGTIAPPTDFRGVARYDDPRTTDSGIPDGSGVHPDMGAYEFVEGADSNLDLIVSDVQGPLTAMAGEIVRVDWTIRNNGTEPARGPWHDEVSLELRPDEPPILAGEFLVGEGVTLGPGESFTASELVRVPGSIIAAHRWHVEANVRGDIFEGPHRDNNTGVSQAQVMIDLPEIALDGLPLARTFESPGQQHWFKLLAEPGQDVRISFDRASDQGTTEIYVAQGFMPSPQRFTVQNREYAASDVTAVVAGPNSQPYYVMVLPRTLPLTDDDFLISAQTLDFTLAGVSPQRVGNTGKVTLRIEGGQLSEQLNYTLVDPTGNVLAATNVMATDATVAFVTFDLGGAAVGRYDVKADDRELSDVLEVFSGIGPQVEFNLSGPAPLRAGRPAMVTLSYSNVGDGDALAPLLTPAVIGGEMRCMGWNQQSTFSGGPGGGEGERRAVAVNVCGRREFVVEDVQIVGQFLGINDEGPAGILPPGVSGQLVFEVIPDIDADLLTVEVITEIDPTAAVDWESLRDAARPPYAREDAWDVLFDNLVAEVGDTFGGLHEVLVDNANHLSGLGIYTNDVAQLFNFEVNQADGFGEISRRYALGALGRGFVDPTDVNLHLHAGGVVSLGSGGRIRVFEDQDDGSFRSATGDLGTLQETGGQFLLTEFDGTQSRYRADGQLESVMDRNGNQTIPEFTAGRLTALDFPDQTRFEFLYHPNGRLMRTSDEAGRVVDFEYDASGEHLVRMIDDGGTTSLNYVAGQGPTREHAVQRMTFPDSSQYDFMYNDAGRLSEVQVNGGAEQFLLDYDSAGTQRIRNALGDTRETRFTDFGRIGQTSDSTGAVWDFRYDDIFALTHILGPEGYHKQFANNEFGQPLSVIGPLGDVTELTYEPDFQQLAMLSDANGISTQQEYDATGNMRRVLYADGSQEQFTFDAQGRLVSYTNRRGQQSQYRYDSRDQLIQQEDDDGTLIDFAHDERRNLASVTDSRGMTQFEYDMADRLIRMTDPANRSMVFEYDALGHRVSETYPDGTSIVYAYDDFGRLRAVEDADGQVLAAYTYDVIGLVQRVDYGNGTATTYSADSEGRLQEVTNLATDGAAMSRVVLQRNPLGLTTSLTTSERVLQYAYDAAGQLVSADLPDGTTVEYEYDSLGNRLSITTDAGVTHYVPNELNQYVRVGSKQLDYDLDGNLIAIRDGDQVSRYGYDEANHLTTAQTSAGLWEFQYDAFGKLIASRHDGDQTDYLVLPSLDLNRVVGAYDDSGEVRNQYLYGLAMFADQDVAGELRYYQPNYRGDVSHVSDSTGTVLASYEYSPFGGLVNGAPSISELAYGAAYGSLAPGPNAYLIGARWYMPEIGRFITGDPLRLGAGDVNFNRYVFNNPVGSIDPSGLINPLYPVTAPTSTPGSAGLHQSVQWVNGQFSSTFGPQVQLPQGLAPQPTPTPPTAPPLTLWQQLTRPLFSSPGAQAGARLGLWGAAAVVAGELIVHGYIRPTYDPESFVPDTGDIMGPRAEAFCRENPQLCNRIRLGIRVRTSIDPNDILGPAGFGDEHFVTGDGALPYTIRFENQTTATAAAQEVHITHTLEPNIDLESFTLGPVQFGRHQITPPLGVNQWETVADLRSEIGHDLKINAELNPDTRTVIWTFTTIDPATGQLTRDPIAGFLPPNDPAGSGEGSVSYLVLAQDALATGDTIDAQARIVFDVNDPIDTPVWTNTIDAASPGSTVAALPAETYAATFDVSWSGQDDPGGSGVANYDLFVSDNGGPFLLWLADTTATSAQFTGEDRHTYAFYSIARDNVGHVELPVPMADAETTINLRPWQNRRNNLDGNDDGFVTPVPDIIARINEINSPAFIDTDGILPLPPPSPIPFYYDRDGDNRLTPVQDILPVLNFINRQSGGEPEEPPASGSLFLLLGGRPWLADAAGIRVGQDHVAAEDVPLQAWRPPSAVSPRDDFMARIGRRPAPHNANRSDAEHGLLDIDELLADLAPDLANEWFADGQRP